MHVYYNAAFNYQYIHTYAVKAYVLITILYSLQTECSINIARSVKFMLEFNHVDQQSNNNFWSFCLSCILCLTFQFRTAKYYFLT